MVNKEKLAELQKKFYKLLNLSEKQRARYKRLIIYTLIVYALFALYIIHVRVVAHNNPRNDIFEDIVQGLPHMIFKPFSIFPIPSGTFVISLLLFITAGMYAFVLISRDRIKNHYDSDIAQGSAKWMEDYSEYKKRFTEPFGVVDDSGPNNVIFSQEIRLSLSAWRTRRNLNLLAIGGSGAGKSFNIVGPNIMQANCSYLVTDPSGGLNKEYGRFLEALGYKVKLFDLTNMDRSAHYNPFTYIRSDKDITILVDTIIANTTPADKKGGDAFWENAETTLLLALIAYLYHFTIKSQQNFSNVMRLIRAADVDENDSSSKSPLDAIFEEVAQYDPENFAVKQYKNFKLAAGKTLKSVLISVVTRLKAFDLQDVVELTDDDDIELDKIGDEKTAIFICLPTGGGPFNFLASTMYSQLFTLLYDYSEGNAEYGHLIMDASNQVVKTVRAKSERESAAAQQEAKEILEGIKNGYIKYNKQYNWYEIRTKDDKLITWRGQKEKAKEWLDGIKEFGKVIPANKQSNRGQRVPIHVSLIADEFANIGKIPKFEEKLATIRKYEISVWIILQSLAQLKKMYKDSWGELSGNCDTFMYIGGGWDEDTAKYVSAAIGKETRKIMNQSFSKGAAGSVSINNTGVELISPAEVRRIGEDECIIIMKSLDPVRDKKYTTLDHPNRKLVESLPGFYFDHSKINYFNANGVKKDEELTKEDRHGEVQEETSDEEAKRKDREEAKKQNAKEISENKDANGNAVVGFANNIEENKDKLAIDLAKASEKLEQNQERMRFVDSTLDKTLDSLRDESVGSYANHITAIQVKESVADDVKM